MVNAKRVRHTLGDHLKEDSALLKDLSDFLSFGLAITSGVFASPIAVFAALTKTAGSVISTGTRLLQRLSPKDGEPRALPNYDQFRVLFYVMCQKSYFEALAESISRVRPSDDLRGTLLSKADSQQLVQAFQDSAAQIDETEVQFYHAVDPTGHHIPLYDTYSRWLSLAVELLQPSEESRKELVERVKQEARKRLHVNIASDEPVSVWIRNYLALEARGHDADQLLSNLSAIRTTLAGWKDPVIRGHSRHAEQWVRYRAALAQLPDQHETMYGEDFGVSKVFVSPSVKYHRVGLGRDSESALPADDIGRLVGALSSTRLSGEDLVFICGGPGSGKSTLCREIASELSKDPDIHPVFLRLRRCKEGVELSAHLEEVLVNEGLVDRLADLQQLSNVVLILDGFDELVLASRARLHHFFSVLLDDLRGGPLRHARAIVAGRDSLFPQGNGLPRGSHILALQPFDKERVALWATKWRGMHVDGKADGFFPATLIDQFDFKNKSAVDLVTWPLTLHLLARVHTAGLIRISKDEWREVDKSHLFHTLLTQTNARQIEKDLGRGRLDQVRLRAFLRSIAWHMYSAFADSLELQDVRPILRQYFPNIPDSDLAEISEVAVLSAPEIHKGEDRGFEFIHKSFSEYLVAEVIAKVVDDASFKITDTRGREQWRHTLPEASRLCCEVLRARIISADVQAMLEPMLGAWHVFDDWQRLEVPVDGRKRLQRLLATIERFEELFADALQGDTVRRVLDHTQGGRTDSPLEPYANYCTGITLIGAAAARQATPPSALGQPVYFSANPFTGAFHRWLFTLQAGEITVDTELGERLFRGLTVRKQSSDPSVGFLDGSIPSMVGPLSLIHGYVSELEQSYIGLAEKLGATFRQMGGRVEALAVRYYGELQQARHPAIVETILSEVLKPHIPTESYTRTAQKAGIEIMESSSTRPRQAQAVISVKLTTSEGERWFEATMLGGKSRLITFDGILIDAPLESTFLLLHLSRGKADVLGPIARVLAEGGTYITNFALGHGVDITAAVVGIDGTGQAAITVETHQVLLSLVNVRAAWAISL